jgi:hypothetical protein
MYEILRKTLIVVICLMLSKLLHMTVSVYMVLFAIVLANFSFSKHIIDLIKPLLPSLFVTFAAVIVNQLFAQHPFIIWTCCIAYFDFVRHRANNNIRVSMATLPLFMIIFITTFQNSTMYNSAIIGFFWDMTLSAGVAVLVTSFINHVMPVKATPTMPTVVFQKVTGIDRLKMLVLVGGGLAFIMINEVTSAVFCLVPLVTSAMQPSHDQMKNHSREKMLTQIGGCSLAILVSLFYSGTEANVFSYFIISSLLIFVMIFWTHHSAVEDRAIHADAVMGFLIPYQLYIAQYGNNFGLNSISLRAVELFIALAVIYMVGHWLDALSKTTIFGQRAIHPVKGLTTQHSELKITTVITKAD